MTSKSKAGGRRDKHPPSPDAANKTAKKAERVAKGKYRQGCKARSAATRKIRCAGCWMTEPSLGEANESLPQLLYFDKGIVA